MLNATILDDATMTAWPPTTYLVQLDQPLRRFNPEDGTLLDEHTYIAVCCKSSEPREVHVFPATSEGGFVDSSMTPIRRRDYATIEQALQGLGYEVSHGLLPVEPPEEGETTDG